VNAHVPGPWPALPYAEWSDTLGTLHMVMQILGKVRVALSEPEPEFAHVALYVTARGISTGPVPSARGIFGVEADFFDHRVYVRTSWGEVHSVALAARPIAGFWADFTAALSAAGIDVVLSTMPQEVPDPIPFAEDTVHAEYDPGLARRFWEILTLIQPVFAEYRAAYHGRVTPVHFFWGSMDLAVTRFSGRPCDPPENADFLMRGSHDAEQISVGFWAGSESFPEPAFYAYSYPEAEGVEVVALAPGAAFFSRDLGEHLLRYDDVRNEPEPGAPIRTFFDSFYTAASMKCAWDATLMPSSQP
jgi:Family of unknown function (DUF5996)